MEVKNEVVGVVGLGFLGRGIAACLLAHGQRVIGYSRTRESHSTAAVYIQRAMEELVEHACLSESDVHNWRDRYVPVDDYRRLADVEFVIESVVEDVAIKNDVFNELERSVGPDVPIATNTSSLPISVLAAERLVPGRFLGMHWAEPAYVTRFLELIRGKDTSDAAFNHAICLAKRVGKNPSIVQKDVPAFIVNRIGYAMFREALNLLETGVADAATIDRSFRNAVGLWAHFAGPFRWIDLTGGPVLYGKTLANVLPTLSNAHDISETLRGLMEANARGVANGRGFYSYSPAEAKLWEDRFHRSVWQVRQWTEELALENE